MHVMRVRHGGDIDHRLAGGVEGVSPPRAHLDRVFFGDACRQMNINALLTLLNTSQALRSLLVRLGIECYALEVDATFVTLKA